jgi:hypothetical protein
VEERYRDIHGKIQIVRAAAEDLAQAGEEIPALRRNLVRILAGIKMLELDFSDLFLLVEEARPGSRTVSGK